MRRIGRSSLIAISCVGVTLVLMQGGFAGEATRKDESRFVNEYIFAKMGLFDINPKTFTFTPAVNADSAKATQHCKNAAAMAREFDPNPYWSSEIDMCFGMVDAFLKKKTSACQLFKSAAKKASDAKAQGIQPTKPNPGSSSRSLVDAENLLQQIGQYQHFFGC